MGEVGKEVRQEVGVCGKGSEKLGGGGNGEGVGEGGGEAGRRRGGEEEGGGGGGRRTWEKLEGAERSWGD